MFNVTNAQSLNNLNVLLVISIYIYTVLTPKYLHIQFQFSIKINEFCILFADNIINLYDGKTLALLE